MKKAWALGVVLLVIASGRVAMATPVERVRVEQAPVEQAWSGKPYVASSGQFGVVQIATLDDKALLAEWARPTPGVSLQTASQMKRNQTIFTFINFKGCKPDAAGNCNVTADFDIFDPTGKSVGHAPGAKVLVGAPPAPAGNIMLSMASIGLSIDDKDPLGPYVVKATITDHVAGVTLHTEETLTAVE